MIVRFKHYYDSLNIALILVMTFPLLSVSNSFNIYRIKVNGGHSAAINVIINFLDKLNQGMNFKI